MGPELPIHVVEMIAQSSANLFQAFWRSFGDCFLAANIFRISISWVDSGETGAVLPILSPKSAELLRQRQDLAHHFILLFLFRDVMCQMNQSLSPVRRLWKITVEILTHNRSPERVFTFRSKFGTSDSFPMQSRTLQFW